MAGKIGSNQSLHRRFFYCAATLRLRGQRFYCIPIENIRISDLTEIIQPREIPQDSKRANTYRVPPAFNGAQ